MRVCVFVCEHTDSFMQVLVVSCARSAVLLSFCHDKKMLKKHIRAWALLEQRHAPPAHLQPPQGGGPLAGGPLAAGESPAGESKVGTCPRGAAAVPGSGAEREQQQHCCCLWRQERHVLCRKVGAEALGENSGPAGAQHALLQALLEPCALAASPQVLWGATSRACCCSFPDDCPGSPASLPCQSFAQALPPVLLLPLSDAAGPGLSHSPSSPAAPLVSVTAGLFLFRTKPCGREKREPDKLNSKQQH